MSIRVVMKPHYSFNGYEWELVRGHWYIAWRLGLPRFIRPARRAFRVINGGL